MKPKLILCLALVLGGVLTGCVTMKTKLNRILRRVFVGLVITAALIIIFYAEEDFRGWHAWNKFKSEWQAKGERFDVASIVPPPVPDDQNVFTAPIFASAVNWARNQNTGVLEPRDVNVTNRMDFNIWRGDSKLWPVGGGNWQMGTLTDLKQWQRYYREFAATPEGKTNGFPVSTQPQTPAADVLLALSIFNPALEELRQALQRPYARMPLDYNNGFDAVGDVLPYLASMKQCAQFLQLRILAELDDGQSQAALDDIKLLLRVDDSIRDQPYLISHLVRIAIAAITLQPVYEGLARQRWSDAQLMELDQALAQMDFLKDFENAAKGEELFAIQELEKQRITRESSQFEPSNGTNKLATISYHVMPSAYFYQNELAFAQMHQRYVLPLIDLTNRIVAPSASRESSAAIQSQMKHGLAPYKVQAVMAFPGISACVMKTARIQSQLDLARVATALERYRLAHGSYPETLDALAPQFIAQLPHDIINGQPLHYRLSNDGQFVLYSVGWNETDDGGVAGLTANGKSLDNQTGDWVWHYSRP